MWKRLWFVMFLGLSSVGNYGFAADAPVVAATELPEATSATQQQQMIPTPEKPFWSAPDESYSRFWVEGGPFHVLVDDSTGDGRLDLIFTSHSDNSIQVFRQVEKRRFEAVGKQDIAGFHPNDTIALSGEPKRYLINAEGIDKLRVVAPQSDGRLTLVAEHPAAHPLSSTPFVWPGWGLGLAVAPYSGSELTLLRDFKPETAETKAVIAIPAGNDPRPARLADLKGDGIPALVFPSFWDNKVWAVEYPGPDRDPKARELAVFRQGWPRHVIPFDVNRDGKVDLLVPMSVQQRIAVLLNDGQGNFTEGEPIPYPGSTGVHAMTVGQDRGGRYLLAGGSRALVLYRERQDVPGGFENILLPLLNWPTRLELVDVDGDGWLDAVVAGKGQVDSMVIYGPLWEAFGKLSSNPPDGAKAD